MACFLASRSLPFVLHLFTAPATVRRRYFQPVRQTAVPLVANFAYLTCNVSDMRHQ